MNKETKKVTVDDVRKNCGVLACGWSRNTLLVTVKPRGHIQVGSRTTEFTLVDCPTADDRSKMNLKSSGGLKQERKTNFNGTFCY